MTERGGRLFVADTDVNEDPGAQHLAEIAGMAVLEIQRFGLPPKVAFSRPVFGSRRSADRWFG
jgi:malate dehydrogenase (oxaloacetate-decarboxylating)(NADP+)